MASYRQQAEWNAQQVLSNVLGLLAADQGSEYEAFATVYNYFMNLSRKKISWTVHLQKLAYEFIDLAFQNNKHSSIKQILKSYRSFTQGQHSQSLKDVLEYYRDKKLQVILEEDILNENLDEIKNLSNIQSEEASSSVIFSSFKPQQKSKKEQLKNKLKIVWEGYKSIIETVRVNQKLQEVFMTTLTKIFNFVDRYNRKHEFKSFCKTLRAGLHTAFNKRDKSEQQKAIYIDIEKADVNDRNIQIRLEQFKITIKLGLWQQAFQILEDINNLMKVRKGTIQNRLKNRYYQNLAILFKRSNYWHYHAFAYYNYFLSSQKNPKITSKQKRQLTDKLLLSVLCIPPVTAQSHQRQDSQLKICNMMISSSRIPSKNELFEMIVAGGYVENASQEIKQLWNFMFLEFDLQSLNKGLDLLKALESPNYAEFKGLLQDILIHRQLISISEIYQRIKIDSLLSLIPLPRAKIEKILLSSYHQKVLDFSLDQSQKILIFEDKTEQLVNPTEEFFGIVIDTALQKEKYRPVQGQFIKQKASRFIEQSEDYFWKIRQFKIDQYRKKLKKPKDQLKNAQHRRKNQEKQQRERAQAQKRVKQAEVQRAAEQKLKEFLAKKVAIEDIIKIKQNRVVRIIGKRVEELTDQQIENITLETLNKNVEQIRLKIQNNKQAKFKKAFVKVDYTQRERRIKLDELIKGTIPNTSVQQKQFHQIKHNSKLDFEQRLALKGKIQNVMSYIKPKILAQEKKMQQKYDQEVKEYKDRLNQLFKEKILNRAKALAEQNKKKKEEEEKKNKQMNDSANEMFGFNTKWTFKKNATEISSGEVSTGIKLGMKKVEESQQPVIKPQYEKKGDNVQKKAWGRKAVEKQQPKKQEPSEELKKQNTFEKPVFQAPPLQGAKTVGKFVFKKDVNTTSTVNNTSANLNKKPEEKKDDKNAPGNKPKKSYVNVN